MPAILGLRGTGEFDQHFRPQNYREAFTMLEPNGTAPLNALLAMTGSESTDDPQYHNFRDEMPERRLAASAAAAAGVTAVSVTITDTLAFCVKGALLVNTVTGEVMQLTADANPAVGTVNVTRNISGTNFAIANGDEIIVAGYAAAEGDRSPSPISFDPTRVFNYTQIFRTSFAVTETLKHTRLRLGDKEQESAAKALKMHMSDIERAMFFGKKHIVNPSTATPTRYTGGLLSSIGTQVDAATNTVPNRITEEEFDNLLIKTVFAYGSNQKVAFVGATVAAQLQAMAKDRWQPEQVSGAYGVKFTKYSTFAGDLLVHLHPQFRQIREMDDCMVIVDFPYLKYRYMEGRDTQLLKDRQGNDEDLKKHEYLTECGLELLQDKVHTVIRNWQKRV